MIAAVTDRDAGSRRAGRQNQPERDLNQAGIERGERNLTLDSVDALAKQLEVTGPSLLQG